MTKVAENDGFYLKLFQISLNWKSFPKISNGNQSNGEFKSLKWNSIHSKWMNISSTLNLVVVFSSFFTLTFDAFALKWCFVCVCEREKNAHKTDYSYQKSCIRLQIVSATEIAQFTDLTYNYRFHTAKNIHITFHIQIATDLKTKQNKNRQRLIRSSHFRWRWSNFMSKRVANC